jgi:threonine/homoserine/homoserine lactone efflux protein
MTEAIGESLGYAVGVAVSPLPIAAVILMLFSSRARSNSIAFAAGWVVGIGGVVVVMQFVPGLDAAGGAPSPTVGWLKLVLGLLLLVAGVRGWRSRPSADEAEMPGWMARIDGLQPGAALGLGVLLSALNPKNALLAIAAGATIAAVDLAATGTAATVAVFTALAASTVLLPTIAYLVAGSRLDQTLAETKDWLTANNAAVMAVLFLVFGASLLGDGLEILGS